VSTIHRRQFLTAAASGVAGAAFASTGAGATRRQGTSGSAAAAAAPQGGVERFAPISLDHLKGGLDGLSAGQLEQHAKLYQGYVTRTNALLDKTQKMVAAGTHLNDQKAPVPEYSELKRRFGFEFNGMVLHEYYFQNLKKGTGDIPQGAALVKCAEKCFGSVQNWWEELMATAKAPGVGWVIACQDPAGKRLFNTWVSMHEEGNIAGYRVVLALDIWEHAFVGDYLPTERGKYLTAFAKNVDWEAVNRRVLA
jgi:Fe-Mn family superoxide dismutase